MSKRHYTSVSSSSPDPFAHHNIDEGAADFFAALNSTSSSSGNEILAHTNLYENDGGTIKEERILENTNQSKTNANQQFYHTSIRNTTTIKSQTTFPSERRSMITNKSIVPPPPVLSIKKEEEKEIKIEEKIVQLLVPEMTLQEIMQLIKKMKAAGKSENDEFSEQQTMTTKLIPRYSCEICGNIEQNNFVTDYARGDTICKGKDGTGCGSVVQDRILHEGSQYRKFEGEEDKSHHGPAPNNLFSIGHNLRTLISNNGVAAGVLRRAADFVEMNLSQMGKDERRTRIGYKDQMKQKACRLIDHAASNLDLHEIVVARAKEMFAEFRDLREHVHQFEAVVAGCILAAYIEIGKEMYVSTQSSRQNKDGRFGGSVYPSATSEITEKELYPFVCTTCKRNFNAKRALQFHHCEEAKDNDTDKSSSTKVKQEDEKKEIPDVFDEAMYRTERRGKDNKLWYICLICERSYLKEETMTEHIKRHENQKRKRGYQKENKDVDNTRIPKQNAIVSTNPSVQINQREEVLFRGLGRKPWLMNLQKEEEENDSNETIETNDIPDNLPNKRIRTQ